MTKAIYMTDMKKLELKAKITQIIESDEGVIVKLNQTIFHPQGGGQPSDIGKLNAKKA